MVEKRYIKVSNEVILMIGLSLISFSFGIWTNYRSLWLESRNISLNNISLILSVSFICSAVTSLSISIFSSKIKIRNLIVEMIVIRIISLLILRYTNNFFFIIFSMIVCISCELIFMLSSYPLIAFINDSDEIYRKKTILEYLSMDIGIILCGILFGYKLGNYIFNYDSFLILSLLSSIISLFFFSLYNTEKNLKINDNNSFMVSLKNIFSFKRNKIYLFSCFFVRISYAIVFDLIMIILTKNLNFTISFASIFIIFSNMIGNLICIYLNKISDKISVKKSILIKFGLRIIFYSLAFVFNSYIYFVICIFVSYITSKILDNKVTGVFIRENDNKDKFIFENVRYFIECVGEAFGAYLAGILLNISLRVLFLNASIITIIQVIILLYNTKFLKKY